MILGGHHINPIDVNFHLQKSLEIFDKYSAEKIWSKKRVKESNLELRKIHSMDKIWQKFLTSEYTQTEKQQIELIWLKVTYLDSILVFEETQNVCTGI